MTWDLGTVSTVEAQGWVGSITEEWDTPMARWAGEGKDWIKLMTQLKPRKEDVIRSFLESMRQAVGQKKESNGSLPTKQSRDLPSP